MVGWRGSGTPTPPPLPLAAEVAAQRDGDSTQADTRNNGSNTSVHQPHPARLPRREDGPSPPVPDKKDSCACGTATRNSTSLGAAIAADVDAAVGPPVTFNGIPFAPTSAANGGSGGRSCFPVDMHSLYIAASLAVEETVGVLVPRLHRIRAGYQLAWDRAREAAARRSRCTAESSSSAPPLCPPASVLVGAFDAWNLLQPLLDLETEFAATLHEIYQHERTVQRFNLNVDAYNAHEAREQQLWGPVYRSSLAISYALCHYLQTHGLEELPEHYLPLLHPVSLFVGCPGGHRELRLKVKEVLVDVAERAKRAQVHVEALPEQQLLEDVALALSGGVQPQSREAQVHPPPPCATSTTTPPCLASDIVSCLATEADVRGVPLAAVELPTPRIFALPSLCDSLSSAPPSQRERLSSA